MDKIIAHIKEKQKEYHEGSPAYNVLRALEVELPSLFHPSQPSEQKPPEKDWVASPKRRVPLKERLDRISEKMKDYHNAIRIEDHDLISAYLLGKKESMKQERERATLKAVQECFKIAESISFDTEDQTGFRFVAVNLDELREKLTK